MAYRLLGVVLWSSSIHQILTAGAKWWPAEARRRFEARLHKGIALVDVKVGEEQAAASKNGPYMHTGRHYPSRSRRR